MKRNMAGLAALALLAGAAHPGATDGGRWASPGPSPHPRNRRTETTEADLARIAAAERKRARRAARNLASPPTGSQQ